MSPPETRATRICVFRRAIPSFDEGQVVKPRMLNASRQRFRVSQLSTSWPGLTRPSTGHLRVSVLPWIAGSRVRQPLAPLAGHFGPAMTKEGVTRRELIPSLTKGGGEFCCEALAPSLADRRVAAGLKGLEGAAVFALQ